MKDAEYELPGGHSTPDNQLRSSPYFRMNRKITLIEVMEEKSASDFKRLMGLGQLQHTQDVIARMGQDNGRASIADILAGDI